MKAARFYEKGKLVIDQIDTGGFEIDTSIVFEVLQIDSNRGFLRVDNDNIRQFVAGFDVLQDFLLRKRERPNGKRRHLQLHSTI